MKEFSSNGSYQLPLFFLFYHDICQVSVEVGGNYKRGYHIYKGATPLRETLAAAACYSTLTNLSQGCSIVDPFCGSGTLLQEYISYVENDYPLQQQTRFHANPHRMLILYVFLKVDNNLFMLVFMFLHLHLLLFIVLCMEMILTKR